MADLAQTVEHGEGSLSRGDAESPRRERDDALSDALDWTEAAITIYTETCTILAVISSQ